MTNFTEVNRGSKVTIMSLASVNDSDYNVTASSSSDDDIISSVINGVQTLIIAMVSSGIILSNIVNLTVLLSASGAMPWATRLFLINLSVSDLLQYRNQEQEYELKKQKNSVYVTVYNVVERLRPFGWCHRLCTCCDTRRHKQLDIRCDYLA